MNPQNLCVLNGYFECNKAIGYEKVKDKFAFASENERDAIFLELSSYLSVTESSEKLRDGTISSFNSLFGPDGVPLVTQNHVSQLDFRKSDLMSAHNTIKSGTLSGIQVSCDTMHKDITSLLTAGKLSGWLTLRDSTLPKAQEALDWWAAEFQEHINDIHNQGVSFWSPSSLLSRTDVDAELN